MTACRSEFPGRILIADAIAVSEICTRNHWHAQIPGLVWSEGMGRPSDAMTIVTGCLPVEATLVRRQRRRCLTLAILYYCDSTLAHPPPALLLSQSGHAPSSQLSLRPPSLPACAPLPRRRRPRGVPRQDQKDLSRCRRVLLLHFLLAEPHIREEAAAQPPARHTGAARAAGHRRQVVLLAQRRKVRPPAGKETNRALVW